MPTYLYRCLQCQAEQFLTHGMLESVTPVCLACGNFCAKAIASAPRVISPPTQAPMEASAAEPAHDCGGACVLHRPAKPPQKNSVP